jgi:hypothetical protein
MYYQHPTLKTPFAGFILILVVFLENAFNRKVAKNRKEKPHYISATSVSRRLKELLRSFPFL